MFIINIIRNSYTTFYLCYILEEYVSFPLTEGDSAVKNNYHDGLPWWYSG